MPENAEARSPRSTNLLTTGVLLVALAGSFLIGLRINADRGPKADSATRGVVTSGQASVTATPDQLEFSATVTNRKPTTAAAMAATNAGVRAVIAALKKSGIAAKDITTQSVSVDPTYDYRNGEDKITGYSSSQQLRIKVRKLDAAGEAISSATTAAGNTVSVGDIALSISKKDDLVAQARTKAVQESKKAAEALAKAAGREVGDLVYVEEVPQAEQPTPYPMADAATSAGGIKSVPISPGEQTVSVTVKVRWSLS